MGPLSWESAIQRRYLVFGALCMLLWVDPAASMSMEESNGCTMTVDDPCVRTGSCGIQGATWTQVVTIDRSDIFDTQGWAGVCDMVHVALVQGRCEPGGAQADVVAFLSSTTSAAIPQIVGPLSCAGEALPSPVPVVGLFGSSLLVAMLGAFGGLALRREKVSSLFR